MAKLPLSGLRVSVISVVLAGPFGSMLLADLGAEVIRVESIHHFPSITRGYMPHPPQFIVPTTGGASGSFSGGLQTYLDHEAGERPWNRFAMFNVQSRNKLSCCIDLTRPEGKDVFRKLIQVSDVFYENNAPQVMENLGLTYEVLKEWKPDIIYLRMPGLGLTGPYRDFPGFGAQLDALGGHMLLKGYPGRDATFTTGEIYHCDACAGATAAFAVLCALHFRSRTGKGQLIDLSQIESFIPQLGEIFMDYTMNQREQTSFGNRDPFTAPQGCYRCQGDDRWVVISVTSDGEWEGLCRAMGNPPWTNEQRFVTNRGRLNNHDELDELIEKWTLSHDNYEVMHILQNEGVPAGPVMDQRDAYHDPQLRARGFFEDVTHPETGTHSYPGMLWKMSKSPLSIRRPAPCLGEHNEYVFKEIIGLSEEEMVKLEKELVIGGDAYI